MKNIHLIPTDKPSRLFYIDKNLFYLLEEKDRTNWNKDLVKCQNIYITSDEEINEGDWVIYNNELQKSDGISFKSVDKKIILTTYQSLIEDGVQVIPDEFLNWFVKNSNCEEVKVEKECNYGECICYMGICKENQKSYKIIIPREEPKQETELDAYYRNGIGGAKQERLEEARRRYKFTEEALEFASTISYAFKEKKSR